MQDLTNSPLRKFHQPEMVKVKPSLKTNNVNCQNEKENPVKSTKGERKKFRKQLWSRVKSLFLSKKLNPKVIKTEGYVYE